MCSSSSNTDNQAQQDPTSSSTSTISNQAQRDSASSSSTINNQAQQGPTSSFSGHQRCEQIDSLDAVNGEQKIFSNNFEIKKNCSFLTDKQDKQFHSSSSSPSGPRSPLTSVTLSNVSDISRSFDELPTQPIRADYPLNKDRRSFRSQWFSQFTWLEYSEQTDLAYCYFCRHFSTGIILNNK